MRRSRIGPAGKAFLLKSRKRLTGIHEKESPYVIKDKRTRGENMSTREECLKPKAKFRATPRRKTRRRAPRFSSRQKGAGGEKEAKAAKEEGGYRDSSAEGRPSITLLLPR